MRSLLIEQISLSSTKFEIAEYVSSSLQLGILLEVSAPKPGNVNRKVDFKTTKFEHFLASAVAVTPSFEHAAQRGIMVSKGKVQPEQIGIGAIIKEAVVNINAWQSGGNTLLGTVLLLSPIAAAAGISLAKNKRISLPNLRENIRLVVKSTTPSDAVAVYEAINMADPNGLAGKAPTLDINDPNSKIRLMEESITLYEVFKISAPYDSISREWVENYPVTFEMGLPYFTQQLKETGNLNTAIVHTFLRVLSKVSDTLIIRKAGPRKAEAVSSKAREVMKLGGLLTSLGREKLSRLDKELRGPMNMLNPGTTADIMAAVLSVALLKGYRP